MLKNKIKDNSGFTIIEVMIVLAIAGLILLIVLLAVPALQRNARNTSRKEDASALVSGISEYVSNNSGTLPVDFTYAGGVLKLCNTASCSGTDAQTNVKVSYYTKTQGGSTACSTGACINLINTAASASPEDELFILEGEICSGNTATATGAAAQSIAIQYGIETSGGFSWQCAGS